LYNQFIVSELSPSSKRALVRQIQWSEQADPPTSWFGLVFSDDQRFIEDAVQTGRKAAHEMGSSPYPLTPKSYNELAVAYHAVEDLATDGYKPIWVNAQSFPLTPEHREQWDSFARSLNQGRDRMLASLSGGLIVIALPEIKPYIRDFCPDYWSMKSLVIEEPVS
jgi:hypothetical protein